jgi:hypothetical protein
MATLGLRVMICFVLMEPVVAVKNSVGAGMCNFLVGLIDGIAVHDYYGDRCFENNYRRVNDESI